MKRSIYLVLVIAIAVLAFESNGRAVLRFIDRFEYVANRTESGAANAFRQAGWSHAKTQQADTGAGDYLYTTTSIPGYTGAFPGGGSRVLAIEALPATLQRQTDFYLQLGDGSANYIPGDVWFQFWIYPQNYGNQRSRYGTRNKFLYVCNDAYPCHSHLWMVGQGSNVYSATNSTPLGDPSNGEFFWNMSSASGVSTTSCACGPS